MCAYAQTNIQLFNQLQMAGYGSDELDSARSAYDLAMRLFTGCFRQSGKTFISHLVGTASILADLPAAAPTVTAGLLHSAYSHGEFGTFERGISEAKRRQIRLVADTETEHIVALYTSSAWDQEAISALRHNLPAAGSIEHEVLLVRLANELEDHLDLAALYSGYAKQRQEAIKSYLYQCTEIAGKLGYPALANGLAQAFEDTLSGQLPAVLQRENENFASAEAIYLIGWKSSFLYPPATHRLRLRMRVRRMFQREFLAGRIRAVLKRSYRL